MSRFHNTLYGDDNLNVLKSFVAEHHQPFIDLIYIDPPFNSGSDYHYQGKMAFSDQWAHEDYAQELVEIQKIYPELAYYLKAHQPFFSYAHMAYLTMLAHRLFYMHRLLKPTGSVYVHCDSTMSHYVKVLMDRVFGATNFQNEIIWQRTSAHSDPHRFGRITDSILFYAKDSPCMFFNRQYQEYDEDYLSKFYCRIDAKGRYRLSDLTGPGVNYQDEAWRGYHPADRGRSWSIPRKAVQSLIRGKNDVLSTTQKLDLLHAHGFIHISRRGVPSYKRYLNTMSGVPLQNLWTDIVPVCAKAKEKNGYPTQKPEALLQRIILCSSQEGDLVADFFCGSGTTLVVAKKLGRRWLGCDNSAEAVQVSKQRLGIT